MKLSILSKSISAAALAVVLGANGVAFAADDAKAHSTGAAAVVSDTAITAKVKARFMDDARLKSTDINVSTANGIVSLTGTAPSHKTSKIAEDLATHVDGVASVDNKISAPSVGAKVEDKTRAVAKKTDRAVSDSWITTKVKSELLVDSLTKGFAISVTTKHHVVALSGNVGSQAAIDRAVVIAKNIKSVDSVDSSAMSVVAR